MIPQYQISRNALVWLLVTQILVLLPHIQRTPVWITVLLAVTMLWRVQVFRGHWSFPPKKIKVPLTLMSCLGLVLSFPRFFGLEALVSVLLTAYALKLLEMYHKRDALILLYLSFFLVMTGFLFDQSIVFALFNVVTLCFIVTALKGLYQQSDSVKPWLSFRHASAMVLQAIPLMILMFILLPRFPSFWNIPLQKGTAKTGMSDSMSPGDFARLTQSADPVMRVTFNNNISQGKMPDTKDLYWRGLTFSKFDGRRWQVDETLYGKPKNFSAAYKLPDNASLFDRSDFLRKIQQFGLYEIDENSADKTNYEVILEATGTQWLYALQNAIPDTAGIWVSYDQLLAKSGFVNSRFRYQASSYPSSLYLFSLPDWQRNLQTRLPNDSNPRSIKRAHEWFAESGSSERYIENLMAWYHDAFYYTLKPPVLGKNSIDEFLFDSKQGFCEHFASSFVFMLRAAGIPARVVVGYQGGEWNPYEGYLLIRQYDAHAWAEVWLEGRGWVRYDPTFAVAPQRILDGFHDTFSNTGDLKLPLLSLDRYRNIALLNILRLQWDRINYDWTRFVLSYDAERQVGLLTKIFGEYSVTRIAAFFIGSSAVFLLLMYGLLLWQERDRTSDPVLRKYRKLVKRLKKSGFPVQAGETPQRYFQRLAASDSRQFLHLKELGNQLYRYWYQGTGNREEDIEAICKKLHM